MQSHHQKAAIKTRDSANLKIKLEQTWAGAAHGGVRAAAAAAVYGIMVFVAVLPILLPIAGLVTGIALALRARRRAQEQKLQTFMAG